MLSKRSSRGAAGEAGDGDAVAEDVVQPAQLDRRRGDLEPRLQDALVVPLARAEHHPMLAEGDRPVGSGRS